MTLGPQRARPRDPAAGLERGARPAAAVGPAVVAAHPAGARLRDRPARVPRHLRGLERDGGRSSPSSLEGARAEMARVAEHGGAVEAVDYMKAALVESHRERIAPHRARRAGRRRRQPLHGDRGVPADRGRRAAASSIVDPAVEAGQPRTALDEWRAARDRRRGRRGARRSCAAWRQTDENIMAATLAAARAGATTGEWAQALRDAFGSYRAPDRRRRGRRRPRRREDIAELRDEVARAVARRSGADLKILVGKPGLDGHSNGAEQIAVRARDVGMEVVYEGIRLTAVADRALRGRRGRPRDRPLDPLGLAPRADPGRHRGAARGRRRGHPGRRRRHHPRGRRRAAARRPASPRSTRPRTSTSADHARHRRRWSRSATASRPRGVSAAPGRRARRAAARRATWRPRRRCSTSSRTARQAARPEIAALLAAVSPAALGGEARRARRRGHRAAGRGQVDAAVRARGGVARARADRRGARRRPVLQALGRRAARRPRADRRPTPPTAASSSARWPPASGSAASPRPRAPPRRRWRPRSTSW